VERADETTRASEVKADLREVTDDKGGCAERADGRSRTLKPKPGFDSCPGER
jgi:hypothetical protein